MPTPSPDRGTLATPCLAALCLACALALAPAPSPAGPPPGQPSGQPGKAHVVAGLELDPPVKRTRPGVAKVTAKVTAKGDKVRVVWGVKAQFEDEDSGFSYEVRDSGRAVQLVIPDSRGIIQVTCLAVVDGEPTSDTFAETYVEVDYRPRERPLPPQKQGSEKAEEGPPPKPDGPQARKAEQPKGDGGKGARPKVVRAYCVVDPEWADSDANQLVSSPGTRNKLRAAGVEALFLKPGDAEYAQLGLEKFAKDAGGLPCVVLVTSEGKVRKVYRPKAGDRAEDVVREATGE